MLDILIPGLLPPPSPEVRLPRLERWLARARTAREPSRSAESWLARRFGLDPAPVAAVSLAVDEAPQPGQWLRADPVFARVERDSLVLHHSAALAITPDEARELVAALREHFARDGLEFRVPRPDRWYVRVPADEVPATTPLAEALGRDVFGRLPRGGGRINWAGAITEAQMLMSTHPVNIAREAARKLPVNALWFWGEGALPKQVPQIYRRVFARDTFAAGLAHLSSAALAPPPAAPRDIGTDGATLVVLDAAANALDAGNAQAWSCAADAIDTAWFGAMGEMLGRHGEVRIILPSAGDTCVASLDRRARWRIFRKPRPLSAHA